MGNGKLAPLVSRCPSAISGGMIFAVIYNMKPTKSRVLCPDCGKMKAVFDSEKAALKFIEYNTKDIIESGGYAPQRAYYCDLCCGWHVTSRRYHNHKTINRVALDRCIEFEKTKKERAERLKLQQKQEKEERDRIRRMLESAEKGTVIPSNSRVAPFLTKSMSLAKDAIGKANQQNFDEARVLLEDALCQLNRAMNIHGATSTKHTFNSYLNELSELLNSEKAPEPSSLDKIMQQLRYLFAQNKSIFSYDPEAEGAYQFDITPENYDEIMQTREAQVMAERERTLQRKDAKLQERLKEKQESENKRVQSEDLIDLAYVEIIQGGTEQARKHLLEAISIIENIKDDYTRDLLTDDLREVMQMFPKSEA